MTAIVAVICSDGVVVGSDSAASFGHGMARTIEQPVKKIDIIGGRIILAGTGAAGLGQRFNHLVHTAYHQQNLFSGSKNSHIQIGKTLSDLGIRDFASTHLKKIDYGCVLAFAQGENFHLLELEYDSFQPEFKTRDMPFVTLGSGQPITDPFLGFLRKVFFAGGPPKLQDGKFLAFWALTHVIQLNPGGVNGPVQLAVLAKGDDGIAASLLEEEELQEHHEAVKAAEDHLQCFKWEVATGNPIQIPEPPSPA